LAETRDSDAARGSRADRGDAALVAQYIHELSERHGSTREGEPGDERTDREEPV
jgi:hypothetical protein